MRVRLIGCGAALLLVGCARPTPRAEPATPEASARHRVSAATGPLRAEEIARIQVQTAYEAVEQLRPDFLHTRGTVSARDIAEQTPEVYINGVHVAGGVGALRSIPASSVTLVRRISAVDATQRYGANHLSPVLEVVVRTR
jgi:hypothetical protein